MILLRMKDLSNNCKKVSVLCVFGLSTTKVSCLLRPVFECVGDICVRLGLELGARWLETSICLLLLSDQLLDSF